MKRSSSVLLFLLLGSIPAAAQTIVPDAERFRVRLEVRYWMPSIDADIQKSSGDHPQGTLIDVKEMLGLKDKNTFDVRATLQLGTGHKIRAGFALLDYSGRKRVEEQIRFEATVYDVDTLVVTSLD